MAERTQEEIETEIQEIIENQIRPSILLDGGDVIYHGFELETGEVLLELTGACIGCPSSTITLKRGIENMLGHYIAEVKSVKSVIDAF